jgi:hypothetical protein
MNMFDWIIFIPTFSLREHLVKVAFDRWQKIPNKKVGDCIHREEVTKFLGKNELKIYKILDKYVSQKEKERGAKF